MEKILYAVKKGDPDWAEVVITTKEDQFATAQAYFEQHGYDRFRIAIINMTVAPDFRGTVQL